MRAFLSTFVVAFVLSAGFTTAYATPLASGGMLVAPMAKSVPAAHHCGKGQRWVPAGYAKHGKYRAGHCTAS
jgi:hypothetical protein